MCFQYIIELPLFQVVSSETEKSGNVKQSGRHSKRFFLEEEPKETHRIHHKQSNKKSKVKEFPKGDLNKVKPNGNRNRIKKGEFLFLCF